MNPAIYKKDFCYVDGQYEHRHYKSNDIQKSKWIRLPKERVEHRIIDPGKGTNCFTSVQLYRDATSLRELKAAMATDAASVTSETFEHLPHDEQEEVLKRARMEEANRLPDQQVHWHGLYFDFDAKWTTAGRKEGLGAYLDAARNDTIELVRFFNHNFEMDAHVLQVWFSGRKGFHVTIRPEFFGMRPHRHLTYMVRQVALDLKTRFELETLDMAVYSVSRMWRVPNTQHLVTGLYKIELTVEELMDTPSATIMEWAKEPRWSLRRGALRGDGQSYMDPSHLWSKSDYSVVPMDDDANKWWEDNYYHHYDAIKDMRAVAPRKPIRIPDGAGADIFPVCIQDLTEHGPKPGGPNRNRVLLPLVGFYHDAGIDQEDALQFVEDWTERHYGEQPHLLKERQDNGRSVVKAAYQGQVQFACRFIRSLSGTGKHGSVACVGEKNCPWVGGEGDQEPKETPMVHLSEATRGCYIGTKVKIPVLVSAIQRTPYEITKEGEVQCTPDREWGPCEECPNNWNGGNGKLVYSLSAQNREALMMISVTDNHKKGAIKQMLGIPKNCYRHRIEPKKMGTIEEVQLIPMVDYALAYKLTDDKDDDIGKKSGRHVVRIGYHEGHGIEANKKYLIDAYVYGHPKDQSLVFTFSEKELAQNDVDTFVMTSELYRKLLAFQVRRDQTVEEKMLEIHRDFEANVHQIGGRIDIAQAMDLCWHSVIDFNFLDNPAQKGWFELLVVGDSGTGKSNSNTTPLVVNGEMRTVGDVRVGDELIGSNGTPTKVLKVFPQGKIPMYEITFRDGVTAEASGDHLWAVSTINTERDGKPFKVMSTKEILDSGLYWKDSGPKANPKGVAKYWVPTVKPVQFTKGDHDIELDLHPYVLGVILGDASVADSATPVISGNPEEDIPMRVEYRLPVGAAVSVYDPPTGWSITGISSIIHDLGLAKKRAEDKFIPKKYLYASTSQRMALLRGLCDTDGHVCSGGQMIEYSTCSEQLAKDITFLVQSLGGLVKTEEKIPTYTYKGEKKEGQLSYRMTFAMPIGVVPVASDKHLAKWSGRDRRYHRKIIDIKPIEPTEATCFKVDADDELFCINDFIVTHNTSIADRLRSHFGLGELIAGEDAKRTGLVYASVQLQGQWTLQWGKLPQNDGRILIIDEFAGIPEDEVARLTQIRSSGMAQGGGVNAHFRAWSRTRLMMISNPKINQGAVAGLNYGIDGISSMFKEKQDLRRVDLACIVERGEVATDLINKRWDQVNHPHQYTADLCRSLILWVWSRDKEDVVWGEGAEQLVVDKAQELGDTYECDIPLAERGDLRLKIARISVAVAARLFSTDSHAKKLYVNREHVQFATEFMDYMYRKPSMAFFEYARQYKQDNMITTERKKRIVHALREYDDCDNIIRALLSLSLFTRPMFKDSVNMSEDDLRKLWKLFTRENLLVRLARGFRKTPAFTVLLKEMGGKKTGYSAPDERVVEKVDSYIDGFDDDDGQEPPF